MSQQTSIKCYALFINHMIRRATMSKGQDSKNEKKNMKKPKKQEDKK